MKFCALQILKDPVNPAMITNVQATRKGVEGFLPTALDHPHQSTCLNEAGVKQKGGRAGVCFFSRPSEHHLLPVLDLIFPPPW